MKKLILSSLSIFMFLMVSDLEAQKKDSPNFAKLDASPMDMALYRKNDEKPVARVIYSRPQKRDREIFGKLVPYGEVWRTGANEATEITFYEDMKIADAVVQKGTYSLYTIPNEKEWTIILNKSTNTWGAYEYTDEDDMVRINVPVRQAGTSIEALSMTFEQTADGADLLIGWDDRYVKVPFKEVK